MVEKISKMFVVPLLAVILFSAGWCSKAESAEGSHPTGLYLGADFVANIPEGDLRGDFQKIDPGIGLDLKIGYIFPIHVALELELGGTGHKVDGVDEEDAGIGFFGVNLRFFPFQFSFADHPLYPYLRVGVARYGLGIDNLSNGLGQRADLKLTGKGLDIGFGLDFYLAPNVSLEGGVTQRFVRYDDIDFLGSSLSQDVKGDMTSIHGGVKYHF
jgi:hypothetical protein